LKKSIVALLIVLALVILVSPGIIGRLAERSLEHDLDIVESGNSDIRITPQGFDRGWFSSEGRHRIELRQGRLTHLIGVLTGNEPTALPVVIVDTHLDHGLIPLGSMTRERGSLTPGLGRAVSKLQLEAPDGTITDLPGTIYSTLGLGGELRSEYVIPAHTFVFGGATTHWGDTDMTLRLDPAGSMTFDASWDSVSSTGNGETISYGKTVASNSFSVDDGGRLGGHFSVDINDMSFPGFDATALHFLIRFSGIEGDAFDNVIRILEQTAGGGTGMPPELDAELRRVVAAGFKLDIDRLDFDTADGPFSSALHLHVKPVDEASFSWPSVLLALDAGAELRIPVKLFERAAADEPDLHAIAGLGYLRREGDFYELHAAFKKGVLTVNDAPIPIPLPAIQ
jgi:Bacterial protein of unknown function (DUF945)